MSRTKWLVAILSLAVAGLLLLLPRGGTPTGPSEIIATSITLHGYSTSGTSEWEIQATEGSIADEEGTLRNVAIRFFAEDGSQLSVAGAELLRTRGESLMPGAVRIEQEDGFLLETSDLAWSEAEDVLHAGPVAFEQRDIRLEAQSFAYDLSTQAARFDGSVVASFDVGALEAETAQWTEEGLSASGGVALHVDLATWEALDGS